MDDTEVHSMHRGLKLMSNTLSELQESIAVGKGRHNLACAPLGRCVTLSKGEATNATYLMKLEISNSKKFKG